MEGLVEGRIVHFVLDRLFLNISNTDTEENTEKQKNVENIICRPAIIINAWGGKLEDGMINLQVFLDGNDDRNYLVSDENAATACWGLALTTGFYIPISFWKTSVKYSESKEVGTWHWPERS